MVRDLVKRRLAGGAGVTVRHDFLRGALNSYRFLSEKAAERARSGNGPSLIEHKLDRFFGHFEGDNQSYRPEGEVQRLRDEAYVDYRLDTE